MIASSRSLRVSKAAAPVQRRSVKVAASASSSSPVVKSIAAASAAAIVFTQLPALALDSAKLLIATPDQANFLKYIDESKQGDSSFKRGGERFPFAEGGRTPAEQKARHLVEKAEDETRKMRRETEDYCDQKLGSFESLLSSTRDAIAQGRRRLQETVLDRDRDRRAAEAAQASREAVAGRPGVTFFDQDAETDGP